MKLMLWHEQVSFRINLIYQPVHSQSFFLAFHVIHLKWRWRSSVQMSSFDLENL